ncbi:hypothetical protein GQ457_02G025500 [Hibiscus cannabinus]
MKPLGSFLPALNALLQLRVPILDLGYRYSPVKTHSKNITVVKGVPVLKIGYRYLAMGIGTRMQYRYAKTLLES